MQNNAVQIPEQFLDIELEDITQSGSKYTTQDKLQTVLVYMSLGSGMKTAQAVNIPVSTVNQWKNSEWWAKIVSRLRQEKRDEFDAGFTRIIEKCTQTIEKQLDNNEVKARDAATIMGITFDKRQVLNNQPTSISGKSVDINNLQAQFEEYLSAKTIDAEVVPDSPTD